MQVHNFRVDKTNHVVLTKKKHVKRNGKHHTLCAIRIDDTAQRVSPQAVTTCDVCIDGLAAFVDVVERDFGFSTWDEYEAQFSKPFDSTA